MCLGDVWPPGWSARAPQRTGAKGTAAAVLQGPARPCGGPPFCSCRQAGRPFGPCWPGPVRRDQLLAIAQDQNGPCSDCTPDNGCFKYRRRPWAMDYRTVGRPLVARSRSLQAQRMSCHGPGCKTRQRQAASGTCEPLPGLGAALRAPRGWSAREKVRWPAASARCGWRGAGKGVRPLPLLSATTVFLSPHNRVRPLLLSSPSAVLERGSHMALSSAEPNDAPPGPPPGRFRSANWPAAGLSFSL